MNMNAYLEIIYQESIQLKAGELSRVNVVIRKWRSDCAKDWVLEIRVSLFSIVAYRFIELLSVNSDSDAIRIGIKKTDEIASEYMNMSEEELWKYVTKDKKLRYKD